MLGRQLLHDSHVVHLGTTLRWQLDHEINSTSWLPEDAAPTERTYDGPRDNCAVDEDSLGDPVCDPCRSGGCEGGQRHDLAETRRADGNRILHLQQGIAQRVTLVKGQVTYPPPHHAVGLTEGKDVHDMRPADARVPCGCTLDIPLRANLGWVHKIFVGVVNDQPALMSATELGQLFQHRQGSHGATRIVRVAHDHHAKVPAGFKLGPQPAHVGQHRVGVARPHQRVDTGHLHSHHVVEVVRSEQHGGVSGVTQGDHQVREPLVRPGSDHHSLLFQTVHCSKFLDQRLSERRVTVVGAILAHFGQRCRVSGSLQCFGWRAPVHDALCQGQETSLAAKHALHPDDAGRICPQDAPRWRGHFLNTSTFKDTAGGHGCHGPWSHRPANSYPTAIGRNELPSQRTCRRTNERRAPRCSRTMGRRLGIPLQNKK
mmetsp:Transcript_56310/g.150543  ORF Transcript_56310/g.150543 Transcript_56310/m.150543 type:complete len:429 (+) Transcript_56310:496-1782(+)